MALSVARSLLGNTKSFAVAIRSVASSSAVTEETIDKVLESKTKAYQYKNALKSVADKKTWTYYELQKASNAIANGLIDLGFEKGSRILAWLPNNYQHYMLQLACARAGLLLVSVNTQLNAAELEKLATRFTPRGFVVSCASVGSARPLEVVSEVIPEIEADYLDILRSQKSPNTRFVFVTEDNLLESVPSNCVPLVDIPVFDPRPAPLDKIVLNKNDISNIFVSRTASGEIETTAYTHGAVIKQALALGEALKLTPTDRIGLAAPLSTYHGYVTGLASIAHHAQLVIPSRNADAKALVSSINEQQLTIVSGTEQVVREAASHIAETKQDITSLRACLVATGSVRSIAPLPNVIAAGGHLGFGPILSINGKKVADTQISISSDPKTNKPVAAGTVGHVFAKGYHVSVDVDDGVEWVNTDLKGEVNADDSVTFQ
eukprot:TRINITY_DN1199_c0_g1_i1.p1 TRINITY_DN1199_c0_g1~~TRINITY_DN1199_c0_g1_i1.p1  ORF type:complete len:433 (+),score=110.72 TRINITY_DN1199_c0_g1_i1:86-1384(+)